LEFEELRQAKKDCFDYLNDIIPEETALLMEWDDELAIQKTPVKADAVSSMQLSPITNMEQNIACNWIVRSQSR
jgi:hypothetical protein